MAPVHPGQSLRQLQQSMADIYMLQNDRFFSTSDLLNQLQRFTMRALKGIRQSDQERIEMNLLVALSWLMSIASCLHIDIEEEVWKRFPARCSYCGDAPCTCKKSRPEHRQKLVPDESARPKTLAEYQNMFDTIYPAESRTLAEAGIHLAEETGEISEAIHNFLGQHLEHQFAEVGLEIADFVSCMFGVANSAHIDLDQAFTAYFKNGCHVCHATPCSCSFAAVAAFKS